MKLPLLCTISYLSWERKCVFDYSAVNDNCLIGICHSNFSKSSKDREDRVMDSVWVLWCRTCNYCSCSTLHGCQLPTHFYWRKRMTMSIGFDFGPSSASSIEIDKFIVFHCSSVLVVFYHLVCSPLCSMWKETKGKAIYVYSHSSWQQVRDFVTSC